MKRFLAWFLVILVIFLGVFIYWRYFYTYSEGYRAGMLQKFSYRGTLFKTYEGEIILSQKNSILPLQIKTLPGSFSISKDTL